MGAVSALLIVVGVVALGVAIFQKLKAGKIAKAPFVSTGEAGTRGEAVSGKNDAISVQGAVKCDQPLVSPVSGTECLYYQLQVIGRWKDGDQSKSDTYLDQKMGAQFGIDDGSGTVTIMAQEGGDFELKETFREKRKEGLFADLKNAFGKGEPIMFGGYAFQNPPMSKASEFECIEKVLPMQPQMYACGKAVPGGIGGSTFSRLLLSGKSREQLLGGAAKVAKFSFIGGGAGVGVGAVLGIIAAVMAPAEPDVSAAVAPMEANFANLPSDEFDLTLGAEFNDPAVLMGNLRGTQPASDLAPHCAGNIAIAPDHVVRVDDPIATLRVLVSSEIDTTLVMQGPDGSYLCADDGEDLNPVYTDSFEPGRYNIWVGSYDAEATGSYRIGFTRDTSLSASAI